MALFYIIAVLFLGTGFIAGYKTGLIKLLMGVLITAVAICSSCYFFIWQYQRLNTWFDFSSIANIITTQLSILFVVLAILLFGVKVLPFRFYKAKPKKISRYLGAITGMLLFAGTFITVITISDVFKTPELITEELDATGVTGLVTASSEIITERLPVYGIKSEEMILAADNIINTTIDEKSNALPVLSPSYIVRPELEAEMLQLINTERALVSLPPLIADSPLIAVARSHSADMLYHNYFSHNTPDGRTPFDRLHAAKINYLYAGENLAFAATIIKAHNGLMLSPGHRANILNKKYSRVGIGVLESPLQGLIISQEFKD